MPILGEVVRVDPDAEFRNDVQLDAYAQPAQNLALLRSYLFSHATPSQAGQELHEVSPVDLLNQVIDAFLDARLENRFVTIANYGHGKSHLALALANYFGRAADAAESRLLLEKLDHSLREPARARRFHDFKHARGAYAVVRLRGDQPHSLRAQVMTGVERALAEHPATQGAHLPFWHDEAARILDAMSPEEEVQANRVLNPVGLDLWSLQEAVRNRADRVEGHNLHDLCVEAIYAAKGVRPDLKEISLSEVVAWVVREYTGPDRPLGGLLILFDEFSLYVERHAARSAPGDLQELLNGVEFARGKVVFLAFAQHDPQTLAEHLPVPNTARESLVRELTRIPKKFVLYSRMENVIDAYLRQDDAAWEQMFQAKMVRRWVNQATDIAHDAFRLRYHVNLHWDVQEFQETVTRGCFPLHPITTAVLCSMRFEVAQSIGAPRTVLGFVLEELRAKAAEPAIVQDRPNWVWPITLVDYFENRMGGDLYSAYGIALKNARQAADELPAHWKRVLKALLLQEAAGVVLRGPEQVEFLGHAAGVSEEVAQAALTALRDRSLIRYEQSTRVFGFWDASVDTGKLEKLLHAKMEALHLTPPKLLDELNQLLTDGKAGPGVAFGRVPMKVEWGHPDDWAVKEILVGPEQLKPDLLAALAQEITLDHRNIREGARGYLLWLVARDETEVSWLRDQTAAALDAALPADTPVPVLAVTPTRPSPELLAAYTRYLALQKFSNTERTEVGSDGYQREQEKTLADLITALAQIRGDREHSLDIARGRETLVVAKPYRTVLHSLPKLNLQTALRELYSRAYPYRPPEFFTQYRIAARGSSSLREAMRTVIPALLRNQPGVLQNFTRSTPVAQDMTNDFLQKKWGLLAADYRIQPPTAHGLQQAWQHLEAVFAPGEQETPLRAGLLPLLNPPYGLDFNTTLLLFAAWFGFNAHDLQVTQVGRRIAHQTLADQLEKGSRDFFQQTLIAQPIALLRRDPGESRREIEALIEHVNTGAFTQQEAGSAKAALDEFGRQEGNHAELRTQAQQAFNTLEAAHTVALAYDREISSILSQAERNSSIDTLVGLLARLPRLPKPGLVQPTAVALVEVRQRLEAQLTAVVEAQCKRWANPDQLSQVDWYRQNLSTEKSHVSQAGLPALLNRIDLALRELRDNEQRLRIQAQESQVQARIDAVRTNGTLAALQADREMLQKLDELSAATEARRDEKLTQLTAEIARLEQQLPAWEERLNKELSAAKLLALKDEMQRSVYRYQDTAQGKALEELLARCAHVYKLVNELERVQHLPLTNPDDYGFKTKLIRDLREQYTPYITGQQGQLIGWTQESLDQRLFAHQNQARRWLDDVKHALHNSSTLAEVLYLLNQEQPFLPDDAADEKAALQQEVQRRVDQEAIEQIELKFRALHDIAQQRLCLQRLQAILNAVPVDGAGP